MAQQFSKSFYNSKEWKAFRQTIINERGPICQKCKKIIINEYKGDDENGYKSKHIQVHHIEEISPANINDVNITLNPDNVMVLCQECHNIIHGRWQGAYKPKRKDKCIYIVYGPPCSGKTRYVLENKERNDIVVDMDRLYQAVTLLDMYDKPDVLKYNVLGLKNLLLDNIRTRYGKWNSAWIIGGYADKYERERLRDEFNAELIYIEVDKEECLYRLKYTDDYRQYNYNEWKKYIEKWFDEYRE